VSKFVLEVIACSVADALAAKRGAHRLEIVRDLSCGGLTPSFKLVQEIKSAVDLPLRIMLRETVGFETNDEDEIKQLCEAAASFASLGVDGVVIGLLENRQIHVELTQRVLDSAPSLNATFHHAFETTTDRFAAIQQLKQLRQVDRILSHGGPGNLFERTQRLNQYQNHAAPELKVLAGGGIDATAIDEIARATTITEFHVGRAARNSFQVEDEVQAPLVSRLAQVLESKQPDQLSR
jgi:copper homeostasis protein